MRRNPKAVAAASLPKLAKCPTGIHGLDTITGGGLPRGRPTLVCGGAGCGKTLLGLEFLVRGTRNSMSPASSCPSKNVPRTWRRTRLAGLRLPT